MRAISRFAALAMALLFSTASPAAETSERLGIGGAMDQAKSGLAENDSLFASNDQSGALAGPEANRANEAPDSVPGQANLEYQGAAGQGATVSGATGVKDSKYGFFSIDNAVSELSSASDTQFYGVMSRLRIGYQLTKRLSIDLHYGRHRYFAVDAAREDAHVCEMEICRGPLPVAKGVSSSTIEIEDYGVGLRVMMSGGSPARHKLFAEVRPTQYQITQKSSAGVVELDETEFDYKASYSLGYQLATPGGYTLSLEYRVSNTKHFKTTGVGISLLGWAFR